MPIFLTFGFQIMSGIHAGALGGFGTCVLQPLKMWRNLKRATLVAVAYLALHRMGFALPPALLQMR